MAGPLAVRDEHSELQAFEQIMNAHDRQVYRVALRILGNVEDAPDVVIVWITD